MDVLLTVIGILGLGAFLIAAWVFVSAAKRYITGEDLREEMEAMESDLSPYRHWKHRSGTDRRKNHHSNVFPLNLDGFVIEHDRRRHHDRRRVA
ncbi:hypothetical protein [Congregibacter sp.]|uniref:hypothetical protein n=1 Tax=Congregibacter sp. TaxID=2744308 RepID=UPI00385EA80A